MKAQEVTKCEKTQMIKLYVMCFAAMLVLGLTAGLVAAEDNASDVLADAEVEADAGTSPDSVFYGLDRAMERISLALTFDKAKRAEKALEIANERLAEVQKMIGENKLDKAEKAQKYHDEISAEAGELVDEIESTDGVNKTEEALEKVLRIREKTRLHAEKVAAVKARILERQAGRMTEEQFVHMREVFDKIIANANQVKTKTEQRKENLETRYKVGAELTDEELEEFESKVREKIRTEIKERDGDDDESEDLESDDLEDDEEDSESNETDSENDSESGSRKGSSSTE